MPRAPTAVLRSYLATKQLNSGCRMHAEGEVSLEITGRERQRQRLRVGGGEEGGRRFLRRTADCVDVARSKKDIQLGTAVGIPNASCTFRFQLLELNPQTKRRPQIAQRLFIDFTYTRPFNRVYGRVYSCVLQLYSVQYSPAYGRLQVYYTADRNWLTNLKLDNDVDARAALRELLLAPHHGCASWRGHCTDQAPRERVDPL